MRRVVVFVLSFIVWCLLAWPYSPVSNGWDGQSLLAGVGAALVVTLIFGDTLTSQPMLLLDPARWFWFICYVPFFVYACIKANLEVAYLVLHPDMPIRPGIVKVRTTLKSEIGLTALANSITLTPGTMTVDIGDEGELYIHWICVKADGEPEATKAIVAPFEGFLRRIIE